MNTSATPHKVSKKPASAYENNPFFVATNGLDLLFKKAQSLGILIAIFLGITTLSSFPSMFARPVAEQPVAKESATQGGQVFPTLPVEVWAIGGLTVLAIVFAIILLSIVAKGILDYTSATLARSETTSINEAFRAVFSNFWAYTWVQVIVAVKTFLWTLLFIIPGIVMSIRYSLSGVAFFDKELKGNESIKHSLALTKNAWLTTYASQNLLNILTLGFIQPLLIPGTNAVLYRQLEAVNEKKPKAHIVSWLTLTIPVILGALLLTGVFLLTWALINNSQVN